MYPNRRSTRLLTIVALIIILEIGMNIPWTHAIPPSTITLYSHGLAKGLSWGRQGLIPINTTNSFTQDDPYVYAYFFAALSNVNVTWQWYDPNGELFRTRTDHVQCDQSKCGFVFWFAIEGSRAAVHFGRWRLDLVVGGSAQYSDFFTIAPVITQDDHWSFIVIQSAPPHVRGELTVTIHPNNLTWSQYQIYMPYAANLTAREANTNRSLYLTTNKTGGNLVTVDLGGARTDGYAFVLSFDLIALRPLLDYSSGSFVLTWRERGWERLGDAHPIPETFEITLPQGATLLDSVGFNAMVLNQTVTMGNAPLISLAATFIRQKGFGWSLIYRDSTWRSLHPSPIHTSAIHTPTGPGLPPAAEPMIPVLPLTLGSLSLWTAIMSIFLLTVSELLSPIYERTGILIDRRRLRIVALLLVAIFLVTTVYRLSVVGVPLAP